MGQSSRGVNLRNRTSKRKRAILIIALALVLAGLTVAAIALSDFLERRKYPLKYEDSIITYSKQYDMDPFLIAAVIDVESGYDPSALSGKGAVGLMQIMPETGSWLYERMRLDGFDPAALQKPEINIKLGCYYLNYLSKRYDGNQADYLAAYNAGMGRVDDWLNNPSYSTDGKTLAVIPYKLTDEYVKKVIQAYEKYKKLYPDRLKDDK